MSTANFHQPDPFPLFAISDEPFIVGLCPACGHVSNYYGERCDACGSDVERTEPEFDVAIYEEWAADVRRELSSYESGLEFHRIELKRGYYSGTQVLVTERYGFDGSVEMGWDDEQTEYAFGLSFDEAAALYRREVEDLTAWMRDELPLYGFREYEVFARFGNGEVWYSLANDEEVA